MPGLDGSGSILRRQGSVKLDVQLVVNTRLATPNAGLEEQGVLPSRLHRVLDGAADMAIGTAFGAATMDLPAAVRTEEGKAKRFPGCAGNHRRAQRLTGLQRHRPQIRAHAVLAACQRTREWRIDHHRTQVRLARARRTVRLSYRWYMGGLLQLKVQALLRATVALGSRALSLRIRATSVGGAPSA